MDWTNLLMVARLVSWPKEVEKMEFQLIRNRDPQQKKSDNLKKEKLDVLKERNQCYRY